MPLSAFSEDLLTYPMRSFSNHLTLVDNNNILFSGKFGIGKTYFLRRYFDEERQKQNFNSQKYNVVHLSPVDYSISATDDIFRYIKYDVIVSLLTQDGFVEGNDLDNLSKLSLFLQENELKIIQKLVQMHPKIGKTAGSLFKAVEEFSKLFKEVTKSNGDLLVDYLDGLQEQTGSIFENDLVTRLIHDTLVKKSQEVQRQNVLVIDDLDRIDPEHIFRILNVFAAHLDTANSKNKLGFDKIIVVCDVRNVRNIFHAKFGLDTDFNGYIDKFYSYEIFHFDNREIVERIASNAFGNYQIESRDERESKYQHARLLQAPQDFCYPLLTLFVRNGFINLRMLSSRMKRPFLINEQDPVRFDNGDFNDRKVNHPLIVHLIILKNMVGSYDEIRFLLNRIPDRYLHWSADDLYRYCTLILRELVFEETKWQINNHYKSMKVNDRLFQYDFRKKDIEFFVDAFEIGEQTQQFAFSKIDFRTLFNELLDLLKRVDPVLTH